MNYHNAKKTCWNCPAFDFKGIVDFRACGQGQEVDVSDDEVFNLGECKRRPELGQIAPDFETFKTSRHKACTASSEISGVISSWCKFLLTIRALTISRAMSAMREFLIRAGTGKVITAGRSALKRGIKDILPS